MKKRHVAALELTEGGHNVQMNIISLKVEGGDVEHGAESLWNVTVVHQKLLEFGYCEDKNEKNEEDEPLRPSPPKMSTRTQAIAKKETKTTNRC